ncbi:MAG: hypothetical protein PVF58_05425 [Candidatus Methanofastidiosia archaeon]
MKKAIIVIVVLGLLGCTTVGADSPFTVIATVPPFVRPGDVNITVQLTVKLESGEYDNVEVELVLPRAFSPSQEGSDTFRLGDMSTSDIQKPPMGVAVFQLDVSPDAVYGDYSIQVYIRTATSTFKDEFDIHVVGETLIEIKSVSTSKTPVEPGDDFELEITVRNIGSNAIKWLKVILNPGGAVPDTTGQGGQTSQTSIPTGIPTGTQQQTPVIIPISSDLERIFKNISPGKSILASYALSVEPSAETKNYAMSVTLVYQDETGMINTETRTIGIKIKGSPHLELQGIEADPAVPFQGDQAIISVTLENNGTDEARSVKVNLSSHLGQYTSFIGTMRRNENNAAVFKILIPEGEKEFPQYIIDNLLNREKTTKYPFTVQVYYEDASGEGYGFAESWDLTTKVQYDKTIFYILGGAMLLIVIGIWRLQSRRRLKVLEE